MEQLGHGSRSAETSEAALAMCQCAASLRDWEARAGRTRSTRCTQSLGVPVPLAGTSRL